MPTKLAEARDEPSPGRRVEWGEAGRREIVTRRAHVL